MIILTLRSVFVGLNGYGCRLVFGKAFFYGIGQLLESYRVHGKLLVKGESKAYMQYRHIINNVNRTCLKQKNEHQYRFT